MRNFCTGLLFLFLVVSLVACFDPSGLPIVKEKFIEQEKEITKQTDEMIEKSEILQEIRKFCSEVPILNGFEFVNKTYALQNKQYLSFSYHSEVSFESVKSQYKSLLPQKGWSFISEESFGVDGMGFRKGNYLVKIYHFETDKIGNYVIHCEKLNK